MTVCRRYLAAAGLAVALGLVQVVDTGSWYSFLPLLVASVCTSTFWIIALFGKRRRSTR